MRLPRAERLNDDVAVLVAAVLGFRHAWKWSRS